ncbi:MAG: hypothetical protein CMJ67_09995 [Planctomycetaceae bacterium]|nr:hypothetical protein [Planctomycetaceae bacterium]
MTNRSKGEENFIDQMTRKLLVLWADHQVRYPEGGAVPSDTPIPYQDHALKKGWLTKREPHRLTAKGFQVAASFLKR